jgi:hypothetical protein
MVQGNLMAMTVSHLLVADERLDRGIKLRRRNFLLQRAH